MIPFNKPVFLGSECDRLIEAVRDNGHLAGGGPFGRECERILEEMLGKTTLLVSSCTHALEMSALLLNLGEGDEVIIPSFTFVSTANAFALQGARPIFVDVDDQGILDLSQVESALSPKTRAVVAVHYAGNSCDLPRLLEICDSVPLVEDAAQAIGGAFEGRALGTFGRFSTISFHETKNIGCGEGGAIVLNDERDLERADRLREKGTDRRKFERGEVDKYTWVGLGSSYSLSDLNAAYLIDQLSSFDMIQQRRRELFQRYARNLGGPLDRVGARYICGHPNNTPNHHLFALVFSKARQRTAFIEFMLSHEILTPFHYVGLHRSPMGREYHDPAVELPNSDRLTECLARLPLYFSMTDAECDEVIGRTQEFLHAL